MDTKWRKDDLPHIIAKLAARPGHEALRTLVSDILRNAFGVSWDDITHEVRLLYHGNRCSLIRPYRWTAGLENNILHFV